jgi:cbb3-type cytochrome oxidase cytochrome c subunit
MMNRSTTFLFIISALIFSIITVIEIEAKSFSVEEKKEIFSQMTLYKKKLNSFYGQPEQVHISYGCTYL